MLLNKYNRNKSGFIQYYSHVGFTLVELLVVIAIIGILSTAAVINLRQFKAKARDARRLSDITQIRKALELYYTTYGQYPNTSCSDLAAIGSCNSINYASSSWISDLTDNLGIDIPNDPINSAENFTDYNDTPFVYLFTRAQSKSADFANYYYILFRLEANDQVDDCNTNPWGTSWSCLGGGNIPL